MLASYQNNNNNTQTLTTTITHSSKKVYDTPPLSTASSLKTSKEISNLPSNYTNTNNINQTNNVIIGVTYRGIEIKSHLPHITQQIIETIVISPKFKKWIDDFNLDLIDFREFIVTDVDFFGQK